MIEADFMREALLLARNAQGRTSPNPMVGAVLVKEGRIIGAGWHRKAGEPHAEIHALRMAGDLAKGATLYVTLEPCSHRGRTGPCAKALVRAGIRRAVIAMKDPNPKVAGRGIHLLQEAGIEVSLGLCEAEARALNRAYLTWIEKQRPYVLLKMAMTLDGKIATGKGTARAITGEAAQKKVHHWRDCFDAILVGLGTVLADDPRLTTRGLDGGKNPVRIVLDSKARIPLTAKILQDGAAPTWIAVTKSAPPARVQALQATGAEVLQVGDGARVDLPFLLKTLAQRDILSLLVEGGGETHFSFLRAGLFDRVAAFIAPKIAGGRDSLTAVEGDGFGSLAEALPLTNLRAEPLGEDILLTADAKEHQKESRE